MYLFSLLSDLSHIKKADPKKKEGPSTYIRLTGSVEDFKVDHFIVHDCMEHVRLLQVRVILPNEPFGDESHDKSCNLENYY